MNQNNLLHFHPAQAYEFIIEIHLYNLIKFRGQLMTGKTDEPRFSGLNRREEVIVVLSLGLDENGKRFASVKADKTTDKVINITKISDLQWNLLSITFSSSSLILVVDDDKIKFEDTQNFDEAILEVLPRELPKLP